MTWSDTLVNMASLARSSTTEAATCCTVPGSWSSGSSWRGELHMQWPATTMIQTLQLPTRALPPTLPRDNVSGDSRSTAPPMLLPPLVPLMHHGKTINPTGPIRSLSNSCCAPQTEPSEYHWQTARMSSAWVGEIRMIWHRHCHNAALFLSLKSIVAPGCTTHAM